MRVFQTPTDTYRAIKSDLKTHEFYISREKIVGQILAELEQRNEKVRVELRRAEAKADTFDEETLKGVLESSSANIMPYNAPAVLEVVNAGADRIIQRIVEFLSKSTSFDNMVPEFMMVEGGMMIRIQEPLNFKISKPGIEGKITATIFDTVSLSYKNERRWLVNNLNRVLSSEEIGYKGKRIRGKFLDTGHMKGYAVVEQKRQRSVRSIAGAAGRKRVTNTEGPQNITQDDLNKIFAPDFFKVTQVSNDDKTTIRVEIESATLNAARGSNEEATLYREYLEALEGAIAKLAGPDAADYFANREGSDSRKTLMRKKLVKEFTKGIRKNPRVKVTSIDTKPKYSNATVSKKGPKKKKPKLVRVKHNVKLPNKMGLQLETPRTRRTKNSTFSLATLKAQLNAKLPAQVRLNMGYPALVNRTGRFAASVQVTDVTATAKGFSSIGYTYMKFPYQTFEPGFRQGSTDRDPRVLIDRSIREIAKDLIAGRFYTRRM